MNNENKGSSIINWLIAAVIGGAIVYLWLKNKNPTLQLSQQPQSQQPSINIDLSGLERRFENLEYKINQLQQINLQPAGTFLTMTTTPKEPLITAKVEDKIMDKEQIDSGKGAEAVSKGNLNKEKYQDYYDVNSTITKATANDPLDFDSASYDSHSIYKILGRRAPILYVMNDSTVTNNYILYIIVSHSGGAAGSRESVLYAGETKEFHEVYELKIRSPTKDAPYRVSEYKHTSHI